MHTVSPRLPLNRLAWSLAPITFDENDFHVPDFGLGIFNRKPQTEPHRTEPNRSFGFFGFRFAVRFLVLHCSVFGFGFGFILKPN